MSNASYALSPWLVALPQLILAFGVVATMLLVAWQRTRRAIQSVTLAIFLLAALAVCFCQFGVAQNVTPLLRIDGDSGFALLLLLASAAVITQVSGRYLRSHGDVHDEYYLLLQLVVFGGGVLVASQHFASLFLGFEILTIALVGLVGYCRAGQYAVECGFKYLILNATASSFMLLGIAYLYSGSGSMAFDRVLTSDGADALALSGVVLVLVGLGFKLSLVPFHYWTADVYQGAPTPITMVLATVSKISILTVLLKLWFAQRYFANELLVSVVSVVAMLSMLAGNVLALKQQNIKRLLGYSSIAHMGYLLLVTLIASEQGQRFAWQTAQFYLTAYVIASLSIFMVLSQSRSSGNGDEDNILLDDWRGLFWQHRLPAMMVLIAVLSYAGIPLTAGFIAKFYLITQVSSQQLWWLLAALIIGSGIGLYYYLRIVFVLFAERPPLPVAGNGADSKYGSWHLDLVMLVLLALGLLFGIFPDLLVTWLPV